MLAVSFQEGGKADLLREKPSAILAEPLDRRRTRSPCDPDPGLFEELARARDEKRSEGSVRETFDGNASIGGIHRSPRKRVKAPEETQIPMALDEKDFTGPALARDREAHRGADHW
jgi:hypothetical protein